MEKEEESAWTPSSLVPSAVQKIQNPSSQERHNRHYWSYGPALPFVVAAAAFAPAFDIEYVAAARDGTQAVCRHLHYRRLK